MKKRLLAGLGIVLLLVAGCSSSISSNHGATNSSYNGSLKNASGLSSSESYDIEENTESGLEEEKEVENEIEQSDVKFDREMLIYSCNIRIDTLDYEQSVGSFKEGLKEAGGFVESEHYSDGVGYYGYYIEENEKTKTYNATVRIPTSEYDSFVNSLGSLGDVRSQDATVENVSQEYKDGTIQLGILEAQEEAYMKMLKKASTIEEIISIQNTLTDIQVQIEQLKSRLRTIETDVAYSYINIEISEVLKYQDKPKEVDTFGKRLSNTVSETYEDFLNFLEELLFFVIRVFPYVIIIGLIGSITFYCQKKYRKKHPRKFSSTNIRENSDGRKYAAPDYGNRINDESNVNNDDNNNGSSDNN